MSDRMSFSTKDLIPLESDTLFRTSPDAGVPECLCSRCGKQILEGGFPIRLFVNGGKDGEYRYHPGCLNAKREGVS